MPCRPSHDCGQADTCARRSAPGADAIDASATLTKRQPRCPMFIDRRGLALIGEEIPMSNTEAAKPAAIIGRPRGEVSKAVEAKIREAGAKGMTLEQLREALPGDKSNSIKWVVKNLKNRHGFRCMSHGRLSVYVAPGTDQDEARKHFEARVVAAKARSAELARETVRRYHRRIAEEGKARRRGQIEEAERIRAERRAAVERDKEARAAQRLAEQQRKAQLHASKRAEIAANNRLARRIKQAGAKAPEPVLAAQPAAAEDWSRARIVKIPKRPGRYEVLDAEPVFTGKALLPPTSCAARALG